MKSIRILLLAISTTACTALLAQEKTDSFKVYGNCGMCKNRIEKAARAAGASSASWDTDSKMIAVTYDSTRTSNETIQKKIAAVGHDTEKFSAEDSVYEKLPGCCLYERKKKTEAAPSNHSHQP